VWNSAPLPSAITPWIHPHRRNIAKLKIGLYFKHQSKNEQSSLNFKTQSEKNGLFCHEMEPIGLCFLRYNTCTSSMCFNYPFQQRKQKTGVDFSKEARNFVKLQQVG
jgi:hypothetical protein